MHVTTHLCALVDVGGGRTLPSKFLKTHTNVCCTEMSMMLLGENSTPESEVSDDSDCFVFCEDASYQLAQCTLSRRLKLPS